MSLFQPAASTAPLAARMRPRSLDDLVGQRHLLGPGSPLRQLIDGRSPSVILWGPPGSGKTTLAHIVGGARRFVELSAVNAGVKDVRAVIESARDRLGMHGESTVLFIDEVHRFSKTQQDALLPAVENGWITMIAATTENPIFSVISPLLSRSVLVTLRELDDDDVRTLLRRAITEPRGLDGQVEVTADAEDHLVRIAGGDARRALTSLEAVAGAGEKVVTLELAEQVLAHAAPRYDTDLHYDVISAFIKSVRGSDADAAMHYLARMVEAGEDPRFIARRLMILASEDIGLADNTALPLAVAAAETVALIGMPEGYYPLAHATLALALARKSNSVGRAMAAASADIKAGHTGPVPVALRSTGAVGYVYPHGHPGAIVPATYAPVPDPRYVELTDQDGPYSVEHARLRAALGRADPPVGSQREGG